MRQSLPFKNSGDWAKWGVLTGQVTLKEGVNKILLAATGDSGPNIDHLQLEKVKSAERR